MELKNACLVIADISGYTRFLVNHATSLLHAEMIITELMEAVIAKSDFPLSIAKLEGDAVFLYAIVDGDPKAAARDVLKQASGFIEAFRVRELELISCNSCACSSCQNIDKLKLKVVLHYGEVAIKEIRQFVELAGEHVILIHRLMKNSIPAKEYTLMTETFYQLSGGLEGEAAETRTEHAEGIGDVPVRVYYPPDLIDFPKHPPLSVPDPGSAFAPLYKKWGDYAQGRLLGLVTRRNFSSLPNPELSLWHRIEYGIDKTMARVVTAVRRPFMQKA